MESKPNRSNEPASSQPDTEAAKPKGEVSGFFVDYWETAKAVCMSPNEFFEHMPREGGFRGPTIFLAVAGGGCALLQVIFTHSILGSLSNWLLTQLVILLMARGIVWIFSQFGGKGSFEETYRIMCFSSPPLLLTGLGSCPLIGGFVAGVGMIWLAILWVLGLKKINGF